MEQLQSKSRTRAVTYPRQVSYHFCRKYTNSTLAEIGASLNRNHSSVVRALGNFETTLRTNPNVRDAVDYLTEKFGKAYL
jgi:chromosomal replication initiator protein